MTEGAGMTDRQEPLTPASGPPMKGPFDPDAIRERVERAAREHTDRQEPLTPEEEAGLRRHSASAFTTELTAEDWLRIWATLDAERAARQEAADTSGLRADVLTLVTEAEYFAARCNDSNNDRRDLDTAIETVRERLAAIAQAPTPDERPLVPHDHSALGCEYPCNVVAGTMEPRR